MSRTSNFMLGLCAAAAFGVASASAATTVTISFTGFCDGMTLTTSNGLVGGTLAGCLTGIALGNKGIDYGLEPLNGTAAVVDNVGSSAAGVSEIVNYVLDFSNNTWANYGSTGGVPTLINSGSFTVSPGQVAVNGTGMPSNVKQGNVVPNALPFSHNATISFDGYCDGMALTFQGDLIGGPLTGCNQGLGFAAGNTGTDFAIEPFGPSSSGVAANVGSTGSGAGYLLNYYLDFANHTWANYYTSDGTPIAFLTGTFTVVSGNNGYGNGPPTTKLH